MPRILLLTPQLPYPPQQGTSLRNYNILKGLLVNNEVDLLAFGSKGDEALVPEGLSGCKAVKVVSPPNRRMRDRLLNLISSRQPDIAHRLNSLEFDMVLSGMLTGHRKDNGAPYDIVQIEGLELARAIPLIKKSSPDSRIVFDDHNAETELQRRAFMTDLSNPRRWIAAAYSFVQVSRLRKYEARACQSADWVTAVSKQDRQYLLKIAPASKVTVVPNCIDVSAYAVEPENQGIEHDLVFTGKMDYRPNVDAVLWFANEIWPTLIKRRPGITWAIVGQRPHPRLEPLNSLPGITITGWVEEVLPYIAGSSVFVMPFRVGSGTRLKLIEAMAAGKAIVSTQVGVEGFDVQNDKQLLMADEPAKFARAVDFLLANVGERKRLGHAAQQYAKQYDWRQIVPKFDVIYRELLG